MSTIDTGTKARTGWQLSIGRVETPITKRPPITKHTFFSSTIQPYDPTKMRLVCSKVDMRPTLEKYHMSRFTLVPISCGQKSVFLKIKK